jgi:hypothetical protein
VNYRLWFPLFLLFWGWQGGHWIAALAAAALLLWALASERRWLLSVGELARVVDLSYLAALITGLTFYNQGRLNDALFGVVLWSPIILLPLLLAQILSSRDGIEWQALFYSLRRGNRREAQRRQDLRPVYLFLCLLAAAQGEGRPDTFFPLLALLLAMLLWQLRPRPGSRLLWALCLGVALLGAQGIQSGLRQAHRQLVEWAISWLSSHSDDPYQAESAIGSMLELKLSGRILYRVRPAQDGPPPLLRTASYNRYVNGTWFNSQHAFQGLIPGPETDSWRWQDKTQARALESLQLRTHLRRDKTLLPLPSGSERLRRLPVSAASRNPLGAVQVEEGPPALTFAVDYGTGSRFDLAPVSADLRVPPAEREGLQRLVGQLELPHLDAARAAARLQTHFHRQFGYSLDLRDMQASRAPISDFLQRWRRGHCEYFATASVLLLRQAGFPARYAVGYAVQEQDPVSGEYLVRSRHAHAWAEFYHQGTWQPLDATPPQWFAEEYASAAFWQPVQDWLSNRYLAFRLWQATDTDRRQTPWLIAAAALLMAILAYRLRSLRPTRRTPRQAKRPDASDDDHPLQPLERRLAARGLRRPADRTYRQWLETLAADDGDWLRPLLRLLPEYYRQRYGAGPVTPQQRQRLQQALREWLEGEAKTDGR